MTDLRSAAEAIASIMGEINGFVTMYSSDEILYRTWTKESLALLNLSMTIAGWVRRTNGARTHAGYPGD